MKQFLKDIITGLDGESADIGRLLWIVGALVFFALSIYAVYRTGTFNPTDFGTGFGLILAGGGAGIGLKAGTEPKPTEEK